MRPDQRALIDPSGQVLGQVLLSGNLAVAPLHVLGPRQTRVTLLDPTGRAGAVELRRVVASDPAWDVIVFSTNIIVQRCRFRFWFRPGESVRVEVRTVESGGAGPGPGGRVATTPLGVRGVVSVGRHSYAAASGEINDVRELDVVFFSRPFARGSSGSPIFLKDSDDLVGFVHGNAPANSGDGVCLVPAESSAVLRVLRRANRHIDELSLFHD